MDAPTPAPSKLLPENAYRKLEPGEEYRPIVPAGDTRAEVTPWSIGLGVIMVIIFTGASAYIALRAGSGIEASIPIAILAIFFGSMRKPKSTILENVMVQSVGQAAGVVAAGATFVIPALYLNRLDASWWQIFLACGIGGFLGVVLIIPLRKYFVKELHGDLPFPEATAINEVLVTGESTARGAGKILILAFCVGAVFDLMVEAVHLWNAGLTTDVLPWGIGETLKELRIEIQIAGIAALFGLGLIIGLKYASIIAAGSVLSVLVLVPLVYFIGKDAGTFTFGKDTFDIGSMGSKAIFDNFIKPIGIGAIAASGIIGILRMGKIVMSSVTLGFKGLSSKTRGENAAERTQLDMSPKNVLLVQLFSALAMGVLFFIVASITSVGDQSYTIGESLLFAVVGMIVGFLLSFLFTPVAAQAIAIVGVNPVSGMTLITVVLAIGALILVGLKGDVGMIVALIVGAAVCTALSTSGALISDFKIGYWIGSTPRNQQRWKFLGVVAAALVVALVIPLMDEAYHFLDPVTGLSNDKVLPAPQANMIAKMAKGLMADPASQPWLLYALGGIAAIMLLMAGVPMLAFALGMYLPIYINMAVLAGAVCAWVIARTGKTTEEKKARGEQVNLVAAGLMAGAAIVGLMIAVLRLTGIGAPIQYISVGVDFQVEAVIEGKPILRDGKPITWCRDLEEESRKECSEILAKKEYVTDENGQNVLDEQGQAVLRHAWYEKGVGRGIGLFMLLMLCFGCYWLARLGAQWQLATAPPEEKNREER
jgi:putative OPT family oligopeptide transporter